MLNKTVVKLHNTVFFLFPNFQKLRKACQQPEALSATGSKSRFLIFADKRVNQNSDWRHGDKSPALKPTQLPLLKKGKERHHSTSLHAKRHQPTQPLVSGHIKVFKSEQTVFRKSPLCDVTNSLGSRRL